MALLSRREFLHLIAVRSAAASFAAGTLLSACDSGERPSALGLGADATQTLIALVDEIIPPTDGMPAASQVGTLAYFELLATSETKLVSTVQTAIRTVDAISEQQSGRHFAQTPSSDRRAVVSALASADSALFLQLRNLVYEGYYLDPQVWERLAYEPYPTGSGGPKMTSFDQALLTRVRAMPKRYLET